MGNLCGGGERPTGSTEERKVNDDINNQLRKEKVKVASEIKLLLLGAGESGKSTFAKQMKILHLNGFTPEEMQAYRTIIASNIVGSMRVLIGAIEELDGLQPLKGDNYVQAARRVMSDEENNFNGVVTPQLSSDIQLLWSHPSIQQAYKRSAEFQLNDSAGYYFDRIPTIGQPTYVPTVQDILHSRTKTTGIQEITFVLQGTTFRLVDVGGQRSERKKWMHCFQDVTAVIFCVAISEYDLRLYEDDTTNRMHESLKLFKEICNTRWFVNTAMILFLNKKDIFMDKIKTVNLSVCFADYTGGLDYDKASEFVKRQFLAQSENPKKPIYPHFTTATDTENVSFVFNAVKDVVLQQTLQDTGMVL